MGATDATVWLCTSPSPKKEKPKCLCLFILIQKKGYLVNSLSLQARMEPCLTPQALTELPNLEYTQEMCSTVADHIHCVISMLNTGVS